MISILLTELLFLFNNVKLSLIVNNNLPWSVQTRPFPVLAFVTVYSSHIAGTTVSSTGDIFGIFSILEGRDISKHSYQRTVPYIF